MVSSLFTLARYLATERPDVLLTSSIPANLTALGGRAISRTATPIVITANLNLTAATGKWGIFIATPLRWLITRSYREAQAIIAVSQGVATDLITVSGIPGERIFQIDNPVDLALVQRQAGESTGHPWLRAGAPPVILAVGKLRPQKDYPTLLRAFARIRANREVRLIILGEGEERGKIERLSKTLGIEADVYMPGFVENPFAWMARAAVFVLSSAWEGSSNVLLEALACGCTIVSTDCPGPREILQDGAIGPLVPVHDDHALAAAILNVLAAPPDRSVLLNRAQDFAIDTGVDAYLRVLAAQVTRRAESPGPSATT